MAKKIWKRIPEFPNYMVSNHGDVYNTLHRRYKRPSTNTGGYVYINLHKNNKSHSVYVHALVAEAFLGRRPTGLTVNHKDGVKTNNCVSNLEWATLSEQQVHAKKMGLNDGPPILMGEDHGMTTLTMHQVMCIRFLAKKKMPYSRIAEKYNVSKATVGRIVRREVWAGRQLRRRPAADK